MTKLYSVRRICPTRIAGGRKLRQRATERRSQGSELFVTSRLCAAVTSIFRCCFSFDLIRSFRSKAHGSLTLGPHWRESQLRQGARAAANFHLFSSPLDAMID